MFIRYLYSLFGSNPGLVERRDVTAPVDTEKSCEPSSLGKFDADVKALREKWGELKTGLCIETTLQELLAVVPRKRARVDAYNSLAKHLRDNLGVNIIIKSRKNT